MCDYRLRFSTISDQPKQNTIRGSVENNAQNKRPRITAAFILAVYLSARILPGFVFSPSSLILYDGNEAIFSPPYAFLTSSKITLDTRAGWQLFDSEVQCQIMR